MSERPRPGPPEPIQAQDAGTRPGSPPPPPAETDAPRERSEGRLAGPDPARPVGGRFPPRPLPRLQYSLLLPVVSSDRRLLPSRAGLKRFDSFAVVNTSPPRPPSPVPVRCLTDVWLR